jgi:ubiquinone/menaquinone biosynthesis C-methylase UbiE
MAKGLEIARKRISYKKPVIVDCGTGTGFVTRQAAKVFPNATFVALDILQGMLFQARNCCRDIETNIFHVQADTFSLPLPDRSVDLLLAQNTIPCFKEFARVCRPGGIVIYADTSAGWIAGLAERLVLRHGVFAKVSVERADLGFYILAE